MKIRVELKNLIMDATYSDEHFRKDGYQLSTWNGPFASIDEEFNIAMDIFFQDEFTIDSNYIKSKGQDEEEITIELINLLYSNVEKAYAVHKITNVPFHFIKEVSGSSGEPHRFEVDGQNYDTYYENEMMSLAKESAHGYHYDMGADEIIGGEYESYFDVVDPNKLAEILRNKELDFELPEDNKKAVLEYAKKFDDLGDIIDSEDLFDYDVYVDSLLQDVSDAIEEISALWGDFLGKQYNVLSGWKPSDVYVFESNS